MVEESIRNRPMRPHFEDIQAHYDLSDDFFGLFQDASRTYSCAYFEPPELTLGEAQIAKIDLNLDKLELRPGMTVLDIGCGWGATMRRAVEKYDVNVIGLTLSKNQLAYTRQLLDQLDSERSRRVLLHGWEEFHEPVDRIVSIEAFEHFGFERYDDFFGNCFKILPDDGRMTIQSSVSYHPYDLNARGKKLSFETARFIKFMVTEIFPGGRLPSTDMMVQRGEKAHFVVPEPLSLRPHYIKTLKIWGDALEANKDIAVRLTSEEVYQRYMKYLRGCEHYFADEMLDVSLVTYLKPKAPIDVSAHGAARPDSPQPADRSVPPGRAPDPPKGEAAMAKELTPHFEDVQAHYDLSDDFFRLFLDPSQTYSCAYFERNDMTLEEAQLAKIDLALGKLDLQPGMTLLDVGCGWGATMSRAIERYDVNVIGLTLSKNQAAYVQRTFDAMNSPRDRRVLLQGWEQFDEPVDRIVSIGAFEHFGHDRYPAFFSMAYDALPSDGVMLLHTICGMNPKYAKELGIPLTFELARFIKFIMTEIFPGGRLPSVSMVEERAAEAAFTVTRVQSLQPHYARTLDCWSEALESHREQAIAIQSQEVYDRYMKYLTGCAKMFRQRQVDVNQFTLAK